MMGMGTAWVSHHRNTQANTASMFRLVFDPFGWKLRHMTADDRGPKRMDTLLIVKMDLIAGVLKLWDGGMVSWRMGISGSFK